MTFVNSFICKTLEITCIVAFLSSRILYSLYWLSSFVRLACGFLHLLLTPSLFLIGLFIHGILQNLLFLFLILICLLVSIHIVYYFHYLPNLIIGFLLLILSIIAFLLFNWKCYNSYSLKISKFLLGICILSLILGFMTLFSLFDNHLFFNCCPILFNYIIFSF